MATILIVDDQPVNRNFLVTLLGYERHRVLEAADGTDALALARSDPPDLIITDLLMPTMDGFEFVRQLRSEPPLALIPVIFYTATYLESDARGLADACGVRHIITKPAEPETVLRVVKGALEPGPPPPPRLEPIEAFRSEHLRLLTATLARKAEVVVPRLNAIIELSVQLASERDPSALVETFCADTRKILGAKYALLGLVRPARTHDRTIVTSGLDAAATTAIPASWAPSGLIQRALEDRCTIRGVAGDAQILGLPPTLGSIASYLVAPIHAPGTVYGWICLVERLGAEGFSEEEEHLGAILAGLVGRIYENGSLYVEATRQARELRRSEQRFRVLAESIPEVFFLIDPHPLRMMYLSPAYEAIWGRPRTAVHEDPRAWMEAIHPEDRAGVEERFGRVWQGEAFDHEYRIQRPDGALRWIWAKSVPLFDDAGKVERVTGLALDITDRKNLDQQLRQAQKMEAVGRLAGGVAHDFNNLLGVIMGYTEASQRTLPADSPAQGKLKEVLKATERAAIITRQLLTFSRKQVVRPTVIGLNTVIVDTGKMLRTLIGEDVDLRTAPAAGLGMIKADLGEMEQVIMNLAVNARDAMPTGGRLTIETANADLGDEFRHAEVTPGRYVMLAVTDSGTGIPKDVQPYIFEPFFTTKEPGKGTGLGLSTVYGIVRQSGGYVFLYSEPGHGTCFRMYFPRVDQPADVVPTAPTAVPSGTETILLVEDEEALRVVTRDALEATGYTVLAARDGSEALDMARAHSGRIHLLATDIIMPGMGGRDLANLLSAERSDIRVLYVSGYTDEALVHHGILPADVELLQKPFTIAALARKVRDVLDGTRRTGEP